MRAGRGSDSGQGLKSRASQSFAGRVDGSGSTVRQTLRVLWMSARGSASRRMTSPRLPGCREPDLCSSPAVRAARMLADFPGLQRREAGGVKCAQGGDGVRPAADALSPLIGGPSCGGRWVTPGSRSLKDLAWTKSAPSTAVGSSTVWYSRSASRKPRAFSVPALKTGTLVRSGLPSGVGGREVREHVADVVDLW